MCPHMSRHTCMHAHMRTQTHIICFHYSQIAKEEFNVVLVKLLPGWVSCSPILLVSSSTCALDLDRNKHTEAFVPILLSFPEIKKL